MARKGTSVKSRVNFSHTAHNNNTKKKTTTKKKHENEHGKRRRWRVNCKFNPNCLNNLGEKMWLSEIKDDYWHTCEDPENEKRGEKAFVGLKNLGATCYVNTFLQLWFHNLQLRSAVYQWVAANDDASSTPVKSLSEIADPTLNTEDKTEVDHSSQPKEQTGSSDSRGLPPLLPSSALTCSGSSICAHLQVIFAQLQYSIRRYIDPMPLIHALGLDTAQQQDAQEFSKLFMSLLESTLSHQSNPEVQGVIQKQFGGDYIYVTKCDKCGTESKRPSRFYELDLNIQGHSSLNQCIKEFLKEEKLDCDNQYFCTQCQSKQDARRYIELKHLPPVLNLQLLRFVFDRKTGYKKKLHSFVQFPDELDMSNILRDKYQGDLSTVYELSAVLMHHGSSAYSGHYVAHIRDNKTKSWYKFNDEDTEKMQSKLKLTGDDESSEPGEKPIRKPKCAKGFHTSRNAYMLVYTRRNEVEPEEEHVHAPIQLQELVAKDNSVFEAWTREMDAIKESMITEGKMNQAEIRSIYEMLPAATTDYAEWVSTDWLRKWLSDKYKATPPIDNSSLLCCHGRLSPEKYQYSKRISCKAADVLYTKYGGVPRLQRDSMCRECVQRKCRSIQFRLRLNEDDKVIKALNKPSHKISTTSDDLWYWVGKSSLQSWKKLAILEQEAQESVCDASVISIPSAAPHTTSNGESNEDKTCKNTAKRTADSMSDAKTSADKEDTANNGKRLRVSQCGREIERILKGQSSGEELSAPEVPGNAITSVQAVAGGGATSQLNGHRKEDEEERASSQGDSITEDDDDSGITKFNEDLLCEHDCLSTSESCRRLVPASIWRRLRSYFSFAREFDATSPTCAQCQTRNEDERKTAAQYKTQAAQERSALANLYYNRQRPTCPSQDTPDTFFYIVANEFLDPWRSFLRSPIRCGRPRGITNAPLLCPHDHLMFSPEAIGVVQDEELAFLYQHEWDTLTQFYSFDHVIKVTNEKEENGGYRLGTSPDVCLECQAARIEEKERECENYRHATIYVRKLTQDHDAEAVQNEFDESKDCIDLDKPQDPDFSSSSCKRPRLSTDGSRRSSRHRKQRGEISLVVHSTQSLRDVKLELMKAFSVMPMDQHLSLKGVQLTDDEAMIGRLGIRPGCLLLLKTDEPTEAAHADSYLPVGSAPEEGFKGTGLLGHS
ncbi:ubiquitin carboxyl-terminal hydrolase 48 isoform X2 [Nematostella vectensis]|uniref:ubiquitin carboxyl-terminal hydrolase 48 isoform X2 n=1 Tax=Nematostella vectensis TaxID=45351 RepID=UPI002076F22D|nr:ubiquitin carboxyl-terminal hydrolase 48 isoform X2 [Nematostella vectensis]